MFNIFDQLIYSLKNIHYFLPAVVICMTIHEWAHAFVAYKLGDYTAKNEGRLSLNPLKHIDPIGAVFLLIFRFGWAKPVPIRTGYFSNPKRDMALTALSGPLANFMLAIAIFPLYTVFTIMHMNLSLSGIVGAVFYYFSTLLLQIVVYNIVFGVFNLIPFPPLDGSRLLMYFLPPRATVALMQFERYSFIVLIVLMNSGVFDFIQGIIGFFASNYIKLAFTIASLF